MTGIRERAARDDLFKLSGTLAPTRLRPAYRLGLLVVAFAMVLLPIVYLGVIAGAVTVVWWHVTNNTWILEGGGLPRLIVYLGPAIAGLVLVFFMVKPVLAREAVPRGGVELDRRSQPLLFSFIHDVCRQVRAPVPESVRVDCQVNASASFAGGVMPGGGLVLTIGLPLAAGLTIRELGGVLAHEFGHFAQGSGMRLTMIVRGINAWFARVVYQRDRWDVTLDHLAKTGDWRFAIILQLSRGAVWATRKLLLVLMMAGHGVSCFMTRQMEYDADSYEIKLAGSDAFIETTARLRELTLAARASYGDLKEAWQRRALPANFPSFLVARGLAIPQATRLEARAVPAGTTGWFDTHPSDADRVRAAREAASPGVLTGGDREASALFANFDKVGLEATRHHYEHDLGLELGSTRLVETGDALDESHKHAEGDRSLEMFFGDRFSAFRPIAVEARRAPAADLDRDRREAAAAMARVRANFGDTFRRVEQLELRRDAVAVAADLLASGFGSVEGDDETFNGVGDTRVADADAAGKLKALAATLAPFDRAAATRLACAVGLLGEPESADDPDSPVTLDDPARRVLAAEALLIMRALGALAAVWPSLQQCRRLVVVIGQLMANRPNVKEPAALDQLIEQRLSQTVKVLKDIREGVGDVPCPEPDGRRTLPLGTVIGVAEGAPDLRPPDIVQRSISTYFRLLGRLSGIALEVEAALGPERR